jgi:hypothetical protein
MDEATARVMIQAHFDASHVSTAGGGPGDDIVRASQIYAEDAVVEWSQGGERLREGAIGAPAVACRGRHVVGCSST